MSRSLTDVAPALLVPAAWLVTLGAHVSPLVSRHALFVALCVMTVLLGAFAVGAREQMTGPVLGVWQGVLVLGFLITLVGAVDMAITPGSDPTLAVTLYGWMILPALAYVATAGPVEKPFSTVYLAGAILALSGAGTYALAGSTVEAAVGIVVVGLGQTAGIVAAVLQNPGTGGED
ncbi:hypothetical protein [Halosimplex salinum]|uniref:hypothetical protein n=1 Tax=Halosimplex salinum TaxID=1710538 RepID=UPI0013DDBC28|nr:hypothetical protein [Halosimplex salinum]